MEADGGNGSYIVRAVWLAMSGQGDEVARTADGFHMLIDAKMAVRARVMHGTMGTIGDFANP